MLDIKLKQTRCFPSDDFDSNLEHCVAAFQEQDAVNPRYRMACVTLFATGLVLNGLVLLLVFFA